MVTEATTEVASLKKALSEAKHKAAVECEERKKQEARVGEVQEELLELRKKSESVEHELKAKEAELAKALTSMKDTKAEAERAHREIQEAKKIAAGKKFFMQSKHVEEAFLLLTRIRSSPGAFADLPRSVSDAAEFYRAQEGNQRRSSYGPSMLGPNTRCL